MGPKSIVERSDVRPEPESRNRDELRAHLGGCGLRLRPAGQTMRRTPMHAARR
jgi:hypothetical protein